MLDGIRDEAATRALIVLENMRYARRQMVWFRAEPDVHWIDGPGESPAAAEMAIPLVQSWLGRLRDTASSDATDGRAGPAVGSEIRS
jgi:hypothetical protein